MSNCGGSVLFQRKGNNEEDCAGDIWDDTALIEAYDAAVAPLKLKLAERTGDFSLLSQLQDKARKKKSKKRRNHAKKMQSASVWQKGDLCRAVYTEDGSTYEARIVSIGTADNTCVVRYLGYGNTEQQCLDDLIPRQEVTSRMIGNSSVSTCDTDSTPSDVSDIAGSKRAKSFNVKRGKIGSGRFSGLMPPPPPPATGSYKEGQGHPFSFPGARFEYSGAPPAPYSTLPPPPPPPPMPDDVIVDENEALCSMLLAWYMSGYHTGYYQGLKQGRSDGMAPIGPPR